MEKSIDSILIPFANGKQPFLTDLLVDDESNKGKKAKKKTNFDDRKAYAVQVSEILATGNVIQQKQAKRMLTCSELLQFGFLMDSEGFAKPPFKLKLKNAQFCRAPNCPVCQQRRSMKWTARLLDVLPLIQKDSPDMRYAMLTLTVQNCHVSELRETKKEMNAALKRMTERKSFPADGYIASFEVTPEKDLFDKKTGKLIRKARPDYCHPHFHVLLALPSTYFNGRNYIKKDGWSEMWQSALKVDYKPVTDIRMVKPKEIVENSGDSENSSKNDLNGLMAAVVETVKYTVKPSDMVQNDDWFLEVANQLYKTRTISVGGIFKDYLKASDIERDLMLDSERTENSGGLMFGWRNDFKRYRFAGFTEIFKPASVPKAFYNPFNFKVIRHFALLTPRSQGYAIRQFFDN
jgi:plasmid rolling circle replication initiator protein Rep